MALGRGRTAVASTSDVRARTMYIILLRAPDDWKGWSGGFSAGGGQRGALIPHSQTSADIDCARRVHSAAEFFSNSPKFDV